MQPKYFQEGGPPRDVFDAPVQAETLSERPHKLLRKPAFEAAENAVEFDAVHIDVLRPCFQRHMDKLKAVARPALREGALKIGGFDAVHLAEERKFQPQPPAAETDGEFSEKCAHAHISSVSHLPEKVNDLAMLFGNSARTLAFFAGFCYNNRKSGQIPRNGDGK